MNAWPMIERCSLAQWRGYDLAERIRMEMEWEVGVPATPSLGHRQIDLWWVMRPTPGNRTCGDTLMSIKVDHYPFDMELDQK